MRRITAKETLAITRTTVLDLSFSEEKSIIFSLGRTLCFLYSKALFKP